MTAATLPRTRTGRPRIRTTGDVLDYWAERIALKNPPNEHFEKSSMICRGDSLFHYGSHFELARILRTRSGETRLVLLNGDQWSGTGGFGNSTSSRQRQTRNAVQRTDAPSMVVPFSALDAAGIDYTTLHPIHVRDDRQTFSERSSRKRPADLTTMDDPDGRTKTEQRWDYSANCYHDVEVPLRVPDPKRTKYFSQGHGSSDGAELREDGLWHWTESRHWLGDSVFRARSTERRTRKATTEELEQRDRHVAWDAEMSDLYHRNALLRNRLRLAEFGERDYDYDRREHWTVRMPDPELAEQLKIEMAGLQQRITACHERQVRANGVDRNGRVSITVQRWATFLSSFDYQESWPLYFLCELPYGAKPNTVEEAIEALKPPEVVAALARGLKVIRQGDLFAIPTKLTKRQIRRMAGGRRANFQKGLRVLGTNHSVTEGIILKGGTTLGRGIMRHEPDAWRTPDHGRQKLGDTWHLLVTNTVPRR